MQHSLARRALALALALAPLSGAIAQAQNYPNKPIKLMVPAATSGVTDYIGRMVGQKLSERLGQPFIIENKPGVGGNLGAEIVAKAAPDGYTLLLGFASPFTVNPWLYKNMSFDGARDFIPLNLMLSFPMVLAVNPSLPVKNVAELLALGKRESKGLTMGSAGNATTSHLTLELLQREAGIKLLHIPYKGEAPTMNAVMAGDIQTAFATGTVVMPLHQSGRVRALAVTSRERSRSYPELPTLAESGVKDFEAVGWIGVLAPAGTPAPIVDRLSRELAAIMRDPAVQKDMISRGLDPIGADGPTFHKRILQERAMWQKVVTESNMRME